MQEVIKISSQKIGKEKVNSVDARELYEVLKIKKEFATWMRHQIKTLDLEIDVDYITFTSRVKRETGASTRKEYIITADTAEHIAMASRTPKGKEVRQYFIAIKKEFIKTLKLNSSDQVAQLKETILSQNKLIATMSPAKESGTFMDDSQMHNHFLDFLYMANKITHDVNTIRHLSPKVDQTHQSMSNFMAFITHRYENIKGVSKYKIDTQDKDANIYVLEEWKKA